MTEPKKPATLGPRHPFDERCDQIYAWLLERAEDSPQGPTVTEVAKATGFGTLEVAEAVGKIPWTFLEGDPNDPDQCRVELDGE